MKRRLYLAMAAGALATVLLPGMVSAKAEDTRVCKKEGWMDLVRADDTPFKNQGACVSYVARGGNVKSPGSSNPTPGAVLAIAYTNTDGVAGFHAADVMIARLIDVDGNGPDAGDRVDLGRYPTSFTAPFGFADWGVDSILVAGFGVVSANELQFTPVGGGVIRFTDYPQSESYAEASPPSGAFSIFSDGRATGGSNTITVQTGSLGSPTTPVGPLSASDTQDDAFVDVEISS